MTVECQVSFQMQDIGALLDTTGEAQEAGAGEAHFKNLPLGTHTFANVRDPAQNFLYIDKTESIHRLKVLMRKPIS